ncbi:MAG: tetratricopeptide repeat protein [Spirochaetia bacterium]|nr:tetratricopeptide repeat protein [Spirochaetia bacterium]
MRNLYILTGFIIIGVSLGFFTINKEYLSPTREAKALLSTGKLYLEQSSKESLKIAVEKFSKIISSFSKTPHAKDALYYLGEAYEKMGLHEAALKKYQELKNFNTDIDMTEKIKFKISKIKIMQSYADEGLNGFMSLLSSTKNPQLRSEVYNELGKYYKKIGDLNSSERNFRIALVEYSRSKEAQLNLARVLIDLGKNNEAYMVYENYLAFYSDIDPQISEILKQYRQEIFEAGNKLYQHKEYSEAINYFSLLTKKFKNTEENEKSLYLTSKILLDQKNYNEALAALEELLNNNINTYNPQALLLKGELFFRQKEYKKASSIFSEAQIKFPNTKEALTAKEWEEEIRRFLIDKENLTHDKSELIMEPENIVNSQTKDNEKSIEISKEPAIFKTNSSNEPVELEYTILPANDDDTITQPILQGDIEIDNNSNTILP